MFDFLFKPFSNFRNLLIKHEIYKALRFHAALASVVYVLILLFLFTTDSISNISIVSLIFLSGALGGVTNNYWRLREVPVNINWFKDERNNILAIIQIYVSPILAGAFGFVLYGIFASGILQGSLFPKFAGVEGVYNTINNLFSLVHPSTQHDAVKSLVWAFVAGFSEAMVPNIVDKLAKEPAQPE